MRYRKIFLLAALAASLAACGPEPADVNEADAADLILTNARVYTLDWGEPGRDGTLAPDAPRGENGWHSDAEAVATRGGEIVFVGGTPDALRLRGEATRVVDLAGATVIPGLVDSHTHVFDLGAKLDAIDPTGVATEEEAVALVAGRAKSVADGEWILGAGWDEGVWTRRGFSAPTRGARCGKAARTSRSIPTTLVPITAYSMACTPPSRARTRTGSRKAADILSSASTSKSRCALTRAGRLMRVSARTKRASSKPVAGQT